VIVTVVTPALNGMRWLPECIDSTQRQAGPDIDVEHIVVDGGSSDGTPDYAASRGCTVLTREEPSIAYAMNKGAFNSAGELICFLGCDDALLPGALDTVVAHYRRDGRRWLVGGVRWLDERGASRGEIKAPPSWVNAPILASLGWNCIAPMSTFVSRSFFEGLGGFDPAFAQAIDYELFARALSREPYARITRTLSAARRHSDAMSMDRDAAHLAALRTIEEQHAPRSWSRRTLYRYSLKLWLNATNPRWSALKWVDAFRARDDARAQSMGPI
jgi:glycosyltransferase involved in cell wall biosynthesis